MDVQKMFAMLTKSVCDLPRDRLVYIHTVEDPEHVRCGRRSACGATSDGPRRPRGWTSMTRTPSSICGRRLTREPVRPQGGDLAKRSRTGSRRPSQGRRRPGRGPQGPRSREVQFVTSPLAAMACQYDGQSEIRIRSSFSRE
jgi:hypothetical protein